jgi:hypothetical protein
LMGYYPANRFLTLNSKANKQLVIKKLNFKNL